MVDEGFVTRQRPGGECNKLTNDPEFIRKVVQGGTRRPDSGIAEITFNLRRDEQITGHPGIDPGQRQEP